MNQYLYSSKKFENNEKMVLNLKNLKNIVNSYRVFDFNDILVNIFYIFLVITSLLIQHFCIFKFDLAEYNFKLIFYSYLFLSQKLLNLLITCTNNYDPLNKYYFNFTFKCWFYINFFIIFFMIFKVYPRLYYINTLVIFYYFVIIFLISINKNKNASYHISLKVKIIYLLKKIALIWFEAIYFILFLPLSSYQSNKINYFLFNTYYILIFSLINIFLLMFYTEYKKKFISFNSFYKVYGFWVEDSNIYQESEEKSLWFFWKDFSQFYPFLKICKFENRFYKNIKNYSYIEKIIKLISTNFKLTKFLICYILLAINLIQSIFFYYNTDKLSYLFMIIQTYFLLIFIIFN